MTIVYSGSHPVGLEVGNGIQANVSVIDAREALCRELIVYSRLSSAFLKRYVGVVTECRISTL